jgi:serine/threonine-protein kinase
VLAYHLLCRRPPFAAQSELALIQMHLRADPPRPSTAWPEIPDELEELLLAMLEKDPKDRPSLAEVERVLRAALAAPAKRPSLPDVLGRPQLWSPPLQPAWIGLAIAATVLAALVSALP